MKATYLELGESKPAGFSPADKRELALFVIFSLCVVSSLFSIAVSQIFLAASLALWLHRLAKGDVRKLEAPPLALPIAAFIITTVISALFSSDFAESAKALKKLSLFLIIMLGCSCLRDFRRINLLYKALFVAAGLVSLYAILQYRGLSPAQRISGFMSHWMTFGGQQMLLITALIAFLVHSGRRALAFVPSLVLAVVAVLLSLTRSVWLALLVSSIVVIALKRPRYALAVPVVAWMILALAPEAIWERAQSIFDLENASNRIRINMASMAKNMLLDRPLVGVGPNMVPKVARAYGADSEFAPSDYIHLHNNLLQIAAERGLPCLAAWLWLIGKLFYDYRRMWLNRDLKGQMRYPLAAAIGALVALLVGGMFEYNFGDSEVVMLLFFIIAAPYAVERSTLKLEYAGAVSA